VNHAPPHSTLAGEPALLLAEGIGDLNQGATFLARLPSDAWDAVRRNGATTNIDAGGSVFIQGDRHESIWLIEDGIIRTLYTAPPVARSRSPTGPPATSSAGRHSSAAASISGPRTWPGAAGFSIYRAAQSGN
jgi:hypothetical protein